MQNNYPSTTKPGTITIPGFYKHYISFLFNASYLVFIRTTVKE